MVWYRNEEPGHLREIGMVLESEWNQDLYEIRYDFEKLLVAKSPIKVMIFRTTAATWNNSWPARQRHPHLQNRTANEKYISLPSKTTNTNSWSKRHI